MLEDRPSRGHSNLVEGVLRSKEDAVAVREVIPRAEGLVAHICRYLVISLVALANDPGLTGPLTHMYSPRNNPIDPN